MDAIDREAKYCPEEFVCIVRTSSHTRFGKKTRLSTLQKEAIDELRRYCYVKVYDRNAFDNHAKFVLIYHFCFTEKVFYHGRYFGSTNLTTKGLSSYGLSSYGVSRRGNYEEFVSTRLRPFTFSPHTRYKGHRYYISDAKRVLDEKIGLYNPSYLRDYIKEHKKKILDLVDHISQIIRHTPIRELFHAYVLSQDLYLQTLAFLDELPGKELTSKIIKETVSEAIEEKMEFPDPLEIEMLATDDEKIMYRTVELLGLTEEGLKKEIEKYLEAIKVTLDYLSEYYRPEEIKEHYDETEREFVRLFEELRKCCEKIGFNFERAKKEIEELIRDLGVEVIDYFITTDVPIEYFEGTLMDVCVLTNKALLGHEIKKGNVSLSRITAR